MRSSVKLRRASDHNARAEHSALQDALRMPEAPLRIECFDVSNLRAPTSWRRWS